MKTIAIDTSMCPRFWKLIGGCHFEARYDLSAARQFEGSVESSASAILSAMDRMRAKTYVRDVCTRCGKTIERGATR